MRGQRTKLGHFLIVSTHFAGTTNDSKIPLKLRNEKFLKRIKLCHNAFSLLCRLTRPECFGESWNIKPSSLQRDILLSWSYLWLMWCFSLQEEEEGNTPSVFETPLTTSMKDAIFQCDYPDCQARFVSRQALNGHIRVHGGRWDIFCIILCHF